MKKVFLVIIIFVIGNSVFAQDARIEFISNLKAINDRYSSLKTMSVDMQSTILDASTGKVLESSLGKNIRDNDNYYRKSGTTEMISNSTHSLIIDHSQKLIYYILNGASPETDNFSPQAMSEFVKLCTSVVEKSEINNIIEYELNMPNQTYNKIIIQLDMTNLLIKKLVFYDNPNIKKGTATVTEIEYSNFNLKPDFSETDFTFSKYIVRNNTTLVVTKEYATYTLYDFTK